MRTLRTMIVAVLAIMSVGCAGQGASLQSPEVLLRAIDVQEFSFSKQSVLLTFDVSNPNPIPLPVRSVRYKVFLENQQFAGGETGSSFTVPARGDNEFSISVDLDLLNSAARLLPLIRAGASRPLQYELHGSLAVAIPFTRPLTFSRDGTIVVR